MRDYEIVYIFRSSLTSEEIEGKLDRYHSIITTEGEGEITASAQWGKRAFAYPIKKQRNGYYVVVRFSANPACLEELERVIKLDEGVLRYLIVLSEPPLPPLETEAADGEAAEETDADEAAEADETEEADEAAAESSDEASDETPSAEGDAGSDDPQEADEAPAPDAEAVAEEEAENAGEDEDEAEEASAGEDPPDGEDVASGEEASEEEEQQTETEDAAAETDADAAAEDEEEE